MTTGRFQLLKTVCLVGLATLGTIVGCAHPGPIATHRATVGSLKASVSQLEYSNENLKKQVADLRSDSTRVENELVQEKEANGELTARLDDAKDVIRKQGGDVTALNRSSGSASQASTASADDEVPPELKSAVRRSRSRRKPPTTQIPRPDSATDSGPGALELPSDPGPQAARDLDDGRWLPVARGRSRGAAVEIR